MLLVYYQCLDASLCDSARRQLQQTRPVNEKITIVFLRLKQP